MNKTALVVGATGLVGSSLAAYLLNEIYYRKVIVLTRRTLSIDDPKLEEIVVDFDNLQNVKLPEPIDDAYCCLGTTIKKAGSEEAFRKVDYTYPLETAKLALKCGAAQYLIITALGADKNSMFFYNRVKGEVEESLQELDFNTLHIFRPSLLLGDRDEQRIGEKIGEKAMKILKPFLVAGLKKYRPITGTTVATAMYKTAQENLQGQFVHASDKIKQFANGPIKLKSQVVP